jgi:hypothetical protein
MYHKGVLVSMTAELGALEPHDGPVRSSRQSGKKESHRRGG